MDSQKSYRTDVPETVLQQISLLCAQEQRISELKTELEKIQTDHANLKHELEPYLIESSHNLTLPITELIVNQASLPPIHRCPDEVLYLIFDQYLSIDPDNNEYDNHRFIRLLLQVCKRWWTIFMETRLWARIVIYDFQDLLHLPDQMSTLPYITACVSRSGNLPLSVDLDMNNLCRDVFILEQLYGFAKTLTNESEHDYVYKTLLDQDWDFSSDLFETRVERALNCLFGPDGDHVKRWSNLSIIFPDNEWAIDIWMRLRRYLHNLTSLTISEFPNDLFDSGNVDPLPKKWSLKRLAFHSGSLDEEIPAIFSDVSSGALEYLAIEASRTLKILTIVPRFIQLRGLDIHCQNSVFKEISLSVVPIHYIHLPLLKSLKLAGHYGVLSRQKFDFPSLELLVIQCWGTHTRLGGLSPRHIRRSIGSWSKEKRDIAPVIRDFILLSTSLQVFAVHESERIEAEEVIAQCKTRGEALALTQLVIEDYNQVEIARINV